MARISVKAIRGCVWLDSPGSRLLLAIAVFEACWSREQVIWQDAALLNLCAHVGVDGHEFPAGIAQPAIREQLKASPEEVIRRGGFGTGFGSSTIFLDEMYFGNDRLSLVKTAILRSPPHQPYTNGVSLFHE